MIDFHGFLLCIEANSACGSHGDLSQAEGIIKPLVDRLSVELFSRYQGYSKCSMLVFGAKLVISSCDAPRDLTTEVTAVAGETNGERELLIVVALEEDRAIIDMSIAGLQVERNGQARIQSSPIGQSLYS